MLLKSPWDTSLQNLGRSFARNPYEPIWIICVHKPHKLAWLLNDTRARVVKCFVSSKPGYKMASKRHPTTQHQKPTSSGDKTSQIQTSRTSISSYNRTDKVIHLSQWVNVEKDEVQSMAGSWSSTHAVWHLAHLIPEICNTIALCCTQGLEWDSIAQPSSQDPLVSNQFPSGFSWSYWKLHWFK